MPWIPAASSNKLFIPFLPKASHNVIPSDGPSGSNQTSVSISFTAARKVHFNRQINSRFNIDQHSANNAQQIKMKKKMCVHADYQISLRLFTFLFADESRRDRKFQAVVK
jgi:hypothetical protein